MKRIFILFLAAAMLLGLSLNAMAATSVTVDKPTIQAGQDVAVTISLDAAIGNVTMFQYDLTYDADLFTPKMNGTDIQVENPYAANGVSVDPKNGTSNCLSVTFLDMSFNGIELAKGTLVTVYFTAKSDVTADTNASFTLSKYAMKDTDNNDPAESTVSGGTASVTVTAAPTNAVTFETAASAARVLQGDSVDVTLTLKTGGVLAAGTLQFTASDGTNVTIPDDGIDLKVTGAKNEGNGKISFGNSDSTAVVSNLAAYTLIATATFATTSSTPVGAYTVSVSVPDGQGLYSADRTPLNPDFGTDAQFTVYALDSIAVKTGPTKTGYVAGETFDPAGLVLTATYTDGVTAEIDSGFTYSPDGALAETDTEVTVSYTEGGVTKTVTLTITVNAAPVTGDVDNSGDLAMADAQELFNYLVGNYDGLTNTNGVLTGTVNGVNIIFDTALADVNGDGKVDSADIVPMLDLISGKTATP